MPASSMSCKPDVVVFYTLILVELQHRNTTKAVEFFPISDVPEVLLASLFSCSRSGPQSFVALAIKETFMCRP